MTTEAGGTDTRRPPGAVPAESTGRAWAPSAARAPLGPTIALTVTLGGACFVVVLAIALLVSTPTPIPDLDAEQNQDTETALAVVAFALILPLSLFLVPRLADRIASGPNADSLSLLTAFLVATLAASILVMSLLPGDGGPFEALMVVGIWWIGAIGLLASVTRASRLRVPASTHLAAYVWALAGALVLATVLAFTSLGSISPLPLVLGAVVGAAVLFACARDTDAGSLRADRPWARRAIDIAVVVLLVWAIPNLVFITAGPLGPFNPGVISFHHNLWLGPVNEMLAGRPLLVDTAAQYGIAPIYLLAAWFEFVPIGYGTLGFLDGVLFAALLASGYCLLRIVGLSRLLAGAALAFAVIVLIYNLEFPVGSLPQHGPLRFGLPVALILIAVAGTRWPQYAGRAQCALVVVVAVASIWSLEAFAYTALTFAAIVCFQAWLRRGPGRLAWLARRAAVTVAACVAAHLIFVVATATFTGALPDYGWYVGFLESFLLGDLAEITYDFTPWSPGLLVGTAYAASAIAFVLLVIRRRDIVERESPTMVALCGTTAYGIALFTYFIDRSPDHVLPYVSLPLVLAGALWVNLLLNKELIESHPQRVGGLAFVLSLTVLLISVAWSQIGDRFSQSPLAAAFPGGAALGDRLDGLWDPPPLDPSAPAGERLLDSYMAGDRRVLIVVPPNLATEILLRSGRSNQLAFSYPLEDSFVPSRTLPALERTADALQPGERMLVNADALSTLRAIEDAPSRDVLNDPIPDSDLIPEQQWVLQRVAERFGVRILHRDQGFVVVALVPR
jgi:hypothetical protein